MIFKMRGESLAFFLALHLAVIEVVAVFGWSDFSSKKSPALRGFLYLSELKLLFVVLAFFFVVFEQFCLYFCWNLHIFSIFHLECTASGSDRTE